MNLNELEKDLRGYRKGPQEKINTDNLWERVSPHIPQSKKNNFRLFLFLLFPLFLLAGGVFWAITNNTASSKNSIDSSQYYKSDSKSTIVEVNEKNTSVSADLNINSGKITAHKESSLDSESLVNASSKAKENTVGQEIDNTAIQEHKTKSPKHFVSLNKPSKKDTKTFQFNNPINLNNQTSFLNPKNNEGSSNDDMSTSRSTLESTTRSSLFGVNNSNSLNESNLVDQISFSNIHSYASGELNPSLEEGKSRALFNINPLPLKTILTFNKNLPSPPKRIYAFQRKAYPKVSVEFGGGYFIPFRTLTLNNPEFENAFVSRSDAEKTLDAWQTSMAFRYMITPRFGLSVGMNYQLLNERSTKELTNTEPVLVQDAVVANFIRLDGSVEPILGELEVNRTIIKTVSRINTFKLVQIPIEVVYSYRINQLKLEVGGGVIPNISSSSTGFWHPDSETEYDLSTDENKFLSSRINVSFTSKAGIAYPLSTNFDVYSNIRYIASLKGFENANYGINQSYNLLGLELGLRINLFK